MGREGCNICVSQILGYRQFLQAYASESLSDPSNANNESYMQTITESKVATSVSLLRGILGETTYRDAVARFMGQDSWCLWLFRGSGDLQIIYIYIYTYTAHIN